MNIKTLIAVLFLGSASNFAISNGAASASSAQEIKPSTNTALIGFVESSLAGNSQVKAAAFALGVSRSLAAAAAKPLYNPELEFSTESSEVDTRSIGLSQTIDWGGKRSARAKAANAATNGAIAEYQRTRHAFSASLLLSLAENQTSHDRSTLAMERVRLMKQFFELAQKRFDAGDLPLVEANFAKLVYADARMQRATASTETAESVQQLIALSNSDSAGIWPVLDTQMPGIGNLGDPQAYFENLPLVQVAQYRVESAKATASLRKREQRSDPTIALIGGKEGDDSLFGLTFSIPIPIRNNFSNEAQAANDQHLQEQQQLIGLQRRAEARLRSAHSRYQIARGAWLDWQQLGQPILSQQSDQLSRLWRAGELSTTDFLVQTSQTIDSQDNALLLRRSLWRAWFEWLSASGQIDFWLSQNTSTGKDSL